MNRRAINSDEYDVPIDGFSHIVVGEPGETTLYVSGLTSRTADGTIVGIGDMAEQARQVMENMASILAAAGATLDDVRQIRTYVTDITTWDVIDPVWRSYWGEHWPASTMVQISRLFDERQMIEMEAIARIPGSSNEGKRRSAS